MKTLASMTSGEWGYLAAASGLFGLIGLSAPQAQVWPLVLVSLGLVAALCGLWQVRRSTAHRS